MPKFKIIHPALIEVYLSGNGFKADLFDPAWGKVFTTPETAHRLEAVAIAKRECAEICGNIPVNVFEVTRPNKQ